MDKKKVWLIRGAAFAISILACALITLTLSDEGIGFFFKYFFSGIFGTSRKIWNLFHETSIVLIVALAVTPCFKMKFWNIGGEGQILMGALGCSVIINFLGGEIADAGVIMLSILVSIAFSVVWCLIPAVFKAKWNTNETLLTLMLNYISVCLVNYFIKKVSPLGTGVLAFNKEAGAGVVPEINGNEFLLKIIVVFVVTVLMAIYLKYSKQGYEISVVGESANTARYIGINTKKVIIRTLILCGLISGITGFLLVSATNYSLNSTSTVGGRGFIGVLVSWLANFNPVFMVLTSFLYVFIQRGANQVGIEARLGASYPSVMTGIFFFFIVATEFFVNYKIVLRSDLQEKMKKLIKKKKDDQENSENQTEEIQTEEDEKEQTFVEAAVSGESIEVGEVAKEDK